MFKSLNRLQGIFNKTFAPLKSKLTEAFVWVHGKGKEKWGLSTFAHMIRSSPPPPFPPLFLFVTLCFQFFQNNYRVSSGFLRFSIKSQLPCCLSGCFFFFIFSSLAISSIVFHFIRLALTQIEIHCGGSPNPIACVHLSQPLCTSRIHNGFIMPDAFISLQSFFFLFFSALTEMLRVTPL